MPEDEKEFGFVATRAPDTVPGASHENSDIEKGAGEPTPESSSEDAMPEPGGGRDPKTTNWIRSLLSWEPKPARYDPENPPKFTVGLNILFAFACTFTVSNLYYNQAILFKIADTFHVSFEKSSSVATLMQAGYAAGLFFICPLGDLFKRRPFIIALVAFTATMWLGLCLTNSFEAFAAISFICGASTVTPQLMLPLVGDLAPAHRRASSLAIVVSGLSLGILVARLLSGILAEYTDWRNIYWFAFAAQYLIFILLYIWLPDYPSKNPGGLNYFKMLWHVLKLLFTEPLLFQASFMTFLMSAVFTSYWTTLSFLLSSPPYSYSSLVIGLFGLIGIVVICSAPIYSRLVLDKTQNLVSSIMGLGIAIIGTSIGTAIGSFSVAGPIIQAIAVDIGIQFAQISNRSAIYGILPDARNRVNTAYMISAFSGQLTGTAVGNRLYAQGGWVYSGSCSIGFLGLALIVCAVRGPREKGWFGWSGGWSFFKDDLPSKKQATQTERALEEAGEVSHPRT